ncbi:hypothetical protein [Rheinheimera gaetbuli]
MKITFRPAALEQHNQGLRKIVIENELASLGLVRIILLAILFAGASFYVFHHFIPTPEKRTLNCNGHKIVMEFMTVSDEVRIKIAKDKTIPLDKATFTQLSPTQLCQYAEGNQ